jgi:hypothetical protein
MRCNISEPWEPSASSAIISGSIRFAIRPRRQKVVTDRPSHSRKHPGLTSLVRDRGPMGPPHSPDRMGQRNRVSRACLKTWSLGLVVGMLRVRCPAKPRVPSFTCPLWLRQKTPCSFLAIPEQRLWDAEWSCPSLTAGRGSESSSHLLDQTPKTFSIGLRCNSLAQRWLG